MHRQSGHVDPFTSDALGGDKVGLSVERIGRAR